MKYFKVLEYLNLALNNIACIEGLDGMECLRKLDLTLNFIPIENLERSVDELVGCPMLEELFLIGNPCMGVGDLGVSSQGDGNPAAASANTAGWDGCRPYIIARLSNLRYLDGKEVRRSERILALQKLSTLTEELRRLSKARLEDQQSIILELEEELDNNDAPTHHNPQTRTKISNEMYAEKQTKEKQETAHLVPQKGEKDWEEEQRATVQKVREREEQQTISVGNEFKVNGEIKQCNQGKWSFWFEDSNTMNGKGGNLTMTVALPKHLSTSLIDVDIHPTYVSIIVKSKILRVLLPVEVKSDQSAAKRIASCGNLELIMPKTNPGEVAIGMPHVRSSQASGTSKGDNNLYASDESELKHQTNGERLGHALLREALTVESLGGIVGNNCREFNCETDEDEPPPLLY